MNDLLKPKELQPLQGDEVLGRGPTVLDFWRWALGDLRMNTARGYLVEYLIARALGDESPVRAEWGPYDVKAADGTLVEIKTAGYLQSWATSKPSTPSWTFKSVTADSVWSEDLGTYRSVQPADRVHVWVFALQTCQDVDAYDPLSVDQWEFRVVPHRQLLKTGQRSARLSFFDRLGVTPVPYNKLEDAVSKARAANDRHRRAS
jgi:hypothetical protein